MWELLLRVGTNQVTKQSRIQNRTWGFQLKRLATLAFSHSVQNFLPTYGWVLLITGKRTSRGPIKYDLITGMAYDSKSRTHKYHEVRAKHKERSIAFNKKTSPYQEDLQIHIMFTDAFPRWNRAKCIAAHLRFLLQLKRSKGEIEYPWSSLKYKCQIRVRTSSP